MYQYKEFWHVLCMYKIPLINAHSDNGGLSLHLHPPYFIYPCLSVSNFVANYICLKVLNQVFHRLNWHDFLIHFNNASFQLKAYNLQFEKHNGLKGTY